MAQKAVSRERFLALRDTITRLENEKLPGLVRAAKAADPAGFGRVDPADAGSNRTVLPLGIADLDRALGGGLALEGLSEIRTAQTRDSGAATGFTLSLAALCQKNHQEKRLGAIILWISQSMASMEAGLPYGLGLSTYGIDHTRFLYSAPRTVQDALWIAEAALGASVFAAVILELRGNPTCLGLSESRRLQVRSRAAGLPLLLLRQAGQQEASSAPLRLDVGPAPSRLRTLPDGSGLEGSIGHPAFRITVEKSRTTLPVSLEPLFLEWNAHDRRFYSFDRTAVHAAATAPSADPVATLSPSAGRPDGPHSLGRVLAFERAS